MQGTKTKYYTALRDNKSKEAVSVPKKDYCDVMSKYKKLRICLENSLRQIYGMQKARNDLGPRTENVY